jgi:glutamate carboxypeptidase
MKGGLVIACGVLRALAGRPELHERVDLLCVTDEEWREVPLRHVPAPGEYHACLTFEGAERVDGREAIVVRRRAAAVVRVTAHGTGAHAGSSASDGRSALLALAELAPKLAAVNDPAAHVSVVPTVLRAGEALNAVPSTGELVCDVRAFDTVALEQVLGAVPAQMGDVRLNASSAERFPPMDTEIATTPWIEQAGALLGEPLVPVARGGASDAAFCAPSVPHTIDGLGPVGGGDHSAAEYVEADSFEPRARIAIALAVAALEATR